MSSRYGPDAVAIVGAACEFPGARDLDAYARLIAEGIDAVRTFPREELLARGLGEAYADDPALVARGGTIEGIDEFDAAFFGFSPGEAEIMDPQLRKCLQCAYLALEDAAATIQAPGRRTGVVAAAGKSSYFLHNLMRRPEYIAKYGLDQTMLYNDRAFIATTISHRLNLTGPSYTVDTACSSTLAAVHLGVQSLLSYESDLMVVGGAAIHDTIGNGYVFREGAMVSPDGVCRPFADGANGTVPGCGVGFVVLKRAVDALEDGDSIHAVILGSAANNDGTRKASFTAPSVDGQTEVIRMAQEIAAVPVDSIGYIEAHGTGTKLGDPIEVRALLDAYGDSDEPCLLGAVKSNIGHLTTASGIAGLIKTAICLRDGVLPALLHCDSPNPYLRLDGTRFRLPRNSARWQQDGPRRAAVSSFGVGGTNVHMLLEQPPPARSLAQDPRPELLTVSARSESALEAGLQRLRDFVAPLAPAALADVAFTLSARHASGPYRAFAIAEAGRFVVGQAADAADVTGASGGIAFAFPGQGAQYPGMARELHRNDPCFRDAFDACAELARTHGGIDLHALVYGDAADVLDDTAHAQPALFAVEYALAQRLIALGARPRLLFGHSLGDYAAACLSGLFSLRDAVALVCARGRAMAVAPPGAMLALATDVALAREVLCEGAEISAVNAAAAATVSGGLDAIAEVERRCAARGISTRRLAVSHAYHSALMEPILEDFRRCFDRVAFGALSIPLVRSDGRIVTEAVAMATAGYWVSHLREAVRFDRAVAAVRADAGIGDIVEVGPGNALSGFLRQAGEGWKVRIHRSLPRAGEALDSRSSLLSLVGRLWCEGAIPDTRALFAGRDLRPCRVPGYAFDRSRYWVEAPSAELQFEHRQFEHQQIAPTLADSIEDCLYAPTWRSVPHAGSPAAALAGERWLVLCAQPQHGAAFADALRAAGAETTLIGHGLASSGADEAEIRIDFDDPAAMKAVWISLAPTLSGPMHLLYFDDGGENGALAVATRAGCVFGAGFPAERVVEVVLCTEGVFRVFGDEAGGDGGSLLALALTLPREEDARVLLIDIAPSHAAAFTVNAAKRIAMARAARARHGNIFAWRGDALWARGFDRIGALPRVVDTDADFAGRTVIVTGGFGGIARAFARYALERGAGHVALIARRAEADHPMHAFADDGPLAELAAWQQRITLHRADAADADALRGALHDAYAVQGRIDIAVHAAGVASGRLLRFMDAASIAPVFSGKALGAAHLIDALAHLPRCRIVLLSTLLCAIGGTGQYAYAAANADLHAQALRAGGRAVVVAWDTWAETGMAVDAMARFRVEESMPTFALSNAQGVRLLHLALNSGQSEVYATRRDLDLLVREALRATAPQPSQAPAPTGVDGPRDAVRRSQGANYAAPEDELQAYLCGVWEHYLGLSGIGVDDGFFDLGGHSLIAGHVVTAINAEYDLRLGIEAVLECPTVRALADRILQMQLEALAEEA